MSNKDYHKVEAYQPVCGESRTFSFSESYKYCDIAYAVRSNDLENIYLC